MSNIFRDVLVVCGDLQTLTALNSVNLASRVNYPYISRNERAQIVGNTRIVGNSNIIGNKKKVQIVELRECVEVSDDSSGNIGTVNVAIAIDLLRRKLFGLFPR